MSTTQWAANLFERVAEVRARSPEMRLGQFFATVALLAEDETSRSIWDVTDTEFAAALKRFASDLERRSS